MDHLTLSDTFNVVSLVQDEDPALLDCHTLGHAIGEREAAKDPAEWTRVVEKCPLFQCSQGCPHGAMMAYYGMEQFTVAEIEKIKPEFKKICSPGKDHTKTDPATYKCVHGIGHLLMVVTGGDIPRSLGVCEYIAGGTDHEFYRACSEAVFMILYQPLGTEQEELVKNNLPSISGLSDFCSNFDPIARQSCHNEAYPLLKGEILDQDTVDRFCEYSNIITIQRRCRQVLYMTSSKIYLQKTDKFIEYCSNARDRWKEVCFLEGAIKVLQTDLTLVASAINICEGAQGESLKNACFDHISVYFPAVYFTKNDPKKKSYCNALPDPWKEQCLRV